jgi:hypothetical protein
MENQYCKVGSITSILNGVNAIAILEYQYQSFTEKAANREYSNTKLGEFFEQKASKIKTILEGLI